jgi:MbtH protein
MIAEWHGPLRETTIANGNDTATDVVVVNHEEQYSIWPADGELPLGWKSDGFSGTKAACLAHIGEVWTDMRPRSLRERIEAEREGLDEG